jgi:Ca2+-binding EF-hand superfamily protein
MKRPFSSTILRYGVSLFTCCLLANGLALRGQQRGTIISGAPPSGGAHLTFRTGGSGTEFGLVINGSDIGTILLKTCDLDRDGKVTPAELNKVAAASFEIWDTNADGSVSGSELSTGLKELFPAPPAGGTRGVRVINGVAVEISPDQLPTPDAQVAKHMLAGGDSNKDGALTFQEVSAFLLGKCFSQWDQDANGSLDAQELDVAFGQLAKPD